MSGTGLRLGLGLVVGAVLVSPGIASAQCFSGSAKASGSVSLPGVGGSLGGSVDTGAAGSVAAGAVAVTRGAPWDKWCTEAACLPKNIPDAQAALQLTGPLLKSLPPLISPTDEAGYLEARAKQALSDAVIKAARDVSGGWSNEVIQDLAVAIAAVITHDQSALARAKGLGAAVVRAALSYALDKVVPPDGGCLGAGRLDAIYEGLSATKVLEAFDFPMKKGSVPAACAPTAKLAASWADAAALAGLVPPDVIRAASLLSHKVDEARLVCGAVAMPPDPLAEAIRALPKPGEPISIAYAKQALDAARKSAEAAKTVVEGEAGTCARSLVELAVLDAGPLTSFVQQGLAEAPLDQVTTVMRAIDQHSDVIRIIGRIAADRGISAQVLRDLVRALATAAGIPTTGVLADAIAELDKAVVEGPPATVQPDVVIAFLSERYDVGEGGAAALKSLLMPSPWVVELNGGLPTVSFQSLNTTIVADGTLGYSSKSLGVIVSGGINYSDITTSAGENEGDHPYGTLEAWWVSGNPWSTVRFEARLTGGLDYYDTTLIPTNAQPGSAYWIDYDSLMIRGTAFLGLRVKSGNCMALQVLAGGGGQYETQDSSSAGGQTTYSLASQTNASAQGTGRVLFRWRVVPGWVGLRLRGDGSYFTITRDTSGATITQTGGVTVTKQNTEQDQQAELHGRAFLDADILSFAHFVPAIWGGVDYTSISGPANNSSSTLPVFGIGIVRSPF